jgi:ethanolamine utilization protein EutN/carbon dioxide concentrating mechanism protein CcmL
MTATRTGSARHSDGRKWPSAPVFEAVEAIVLIGKVIGSLVATVKDEKLDNLRFMVVRQVGVDGKETGAYVVAVDAVGSGVGEMVLYATGSSARQTVITDKRPCDAVIMAIVDTWDVDGQVKYQKSEA